MYLLLFSFSYAWGLFQTLFKQLAESNKNKSVFSKFFLKKKTLCFSKDEFLLNYLLSLGWIPLGGKYQFLYLLGGVNWYPIK